MRIEILVKPGSKRPGIEIPAGESGATLIVRVREPAREGKANAAVIQALARHYGVPRSYIHIVYGTGGRRKIVEIARE